MSNKSNSNKFFLAIDIGASSGRHIVGYKDCDRLFIKEVYRFANEIKFIDGQYCWDIDALFTHIKCGIKTAFELGYKLTSISIDTWGVDTVLLDEQDKPIGNAVAYRDTRTAKAIDEYFNTNSQHLSKEEVYKITGIQFLSFNSLYQLFVTSEHIKKLTKTILLIPDYFVFLLTGKKMCEYTNASTMQLLDLKTNSWSEKLISSTGFDKSAFLPLSLPKTEVGFLRKELIDEFGIAGTDNEQVKIVLAASHDTASAFISSHNIDGNGINLSSGTWSLIGIESKKYVNSHASYEANFTNEGGIDYRYRYLKNIMGLWVIQEVKRNYDDKYSFLELVELAKKAIDYNVIININDNSFYKPENMIDAIRSYCVAHHQQVPIEVGEVAKAVFVGLSECYVLAISDIERLTGRTYDFILIFGGGCQNEYLNQLVADRTGLTVKAGPIEATAIGNIVVQMLACCELESLDIARELIYQSFDIKEFTLTVKTVQAVK